MVSGLATFFSGTLESGEILWYSRWGWKSKTVLLIPQVRPGGTHCHLKNKIEGINGMLWSKLNARKS